MTKLEIGKLYVAGYNLLVFPTEEKTRRSGCSVAMKPVAFDVDWWSKNLNCSISVISPGATFLVCEMAADEFACQPVFVLFGETKGWINACPTANLNIKELAP